MRAADDLDLDEREAHLWWDPCSHAFRSLHAVDEHRKRVLDAWLGARHDGRVVVDLGCGGGLLSKHFVDAGAHVTGIDVSAASLHVARRRLAGAFVRGDARRTPFANGSADIVLLSDVLEHVERPADVLAEAARILRRGGACFVSTLNRTFRARLLGVWFAEGLGLVPRGTHDADMYVKPSELVRWSRGRGLHVERAQGESIALGRTIRRWTVALRDSDVCAVAYTALLRKA